MKSDKMKCESSESLVSDLMSTVMDGAGVDLKDQTETWHFAGEPNPNSHSKNKYHSRLSQFEDSHHCFISNKNNLSLKINLLSAQ